jgi:hypothetical protein
MPRRCTKTPIICLTREYKIYSFLSREGIRTVEKMESVEAPVEAVEPEVFGKPVFKFVFTLWDVNSEERIGVQGDERCPGFGYISHVARWRVGAHLEGDFLLHDLVLIQETF